VLASLHILHAKLPASDHLILANSEGEWLVSVDRAVEDLVAPVEPADVVHLDCGSFGNVLLFLDIRWLFGELDCELCASVSVLGLGFLLLQLIDHSELVGGRSCAYSRLTS
jgi:hypothetical protein